MASMKVWFASFIFALTLSIPSARAMSPDTVWSQIETEHFIVVFDSKQRQLGEMYARFAEQSFLATAPLFGVWPNKTVLVISDTTDVANGFATGVPYPMIVTFPVLPTLLDSIADYGNWGLELVMHEYVHILNFEPATGVMRPFRWIFGSIVRPNILLPRWYSEGLAVELETRLSSYGRLRSANYLSILRAIVQEDRLWQESIARINETSIPDWPGGARPYLMGAMLWNEMIRQGGDSVIKDLNLAYSRRLPFLLSGPVKSRLGLDYTQLLDQSYERIENSVNKQLESIRAAGETKDSKLGQTGFFNHSPAISPDGKQLVFVSRDHDADARVLRYERSATSDSFATVASPKNRPKYDGVTRVSWLPDSKGYVFDSVKFFDRYYELSDLYVIRFGEKENTRLSRGLRAREPAVSPDGRTIVYVQNTAGSTQLGVMKIDGGNPTPVYVPPLQTRIARPEFISKDEVIFSEKRDDGAEGFKILKLALNEDGSAKGPSPEPREVLAAYRPVYFPRMTSEGLLFVSGRSGVSNLYLADKQLKDARAVTNSATRITGGDLDPHTGDLVYSRLVADGPLIHVAKKEDWSKAPKQPPTVGALADMSWPPHVPQKADVKIEVEDYSAWPHLLPRYWMPYMFFIPEGVYLQASTSGSDPVGHHTYSAAGSWDSLTNKPSLAATYTNKQTRVPVLLSAQDVYEYIYSGGFNRRTTSGLLTGMFYLPKLSNSWMGMLGAQYLKTELFSDEVTRGGAHVGIAYKDASKRGKQISPESGGAATVGFTRYLPNLGNTAYEETTASGTYYFSKWLPERHAIMLNANATIAPRLNNALLGRTTVGGNFQTGILQTGYLMRGYGSGVFIGRNLISSTMEYRFPIAYPYSGWGTTPLFVQRWHMAAFVDAVTLDGFSYDSKRKAYNTEKLGRFYFGTGLEVRIDATIFYHLPIQLIFGGYYGFDPKLNPAGITPFVGFGL